MKIDGSLGSLLQGVSQQAPRDRLDGQCTLQENMTSDAVRGLSRRPPTDLVGYLGSASSILGWHNFETRDGNKFLAMFRTGGLSVFDLNAVEQPVSIDPSAAAYLTGTTNIRCNTTEDDSTLVVNPAATVTMNSSATAYFNTQGTDAMIVQVLGGEFSRYYTLYINGAMVARYLTVSPYQPDHNPTSSGYITTSFIAQRLLDGMTGTPGTTSPDSNGSELITTGLCSTWERRIVDDVLYFKAPNGTTFTASCTDGAAGDNLKVTTNTVTDIADLPRIAPHYYAIRIAENTDPEKDLWYKFVVSGREGSATPDGSAFGLAGYWTETVKPGMDTAFNAASMPHRLTYNGSAFSLGRVAWDPRSVGTDTSNPKPSFVGSKINDVTSFQGRTVFLSGSNVIMSRTNRPYNFWRGSASALADTDPIDENSTVESSQMQSAVQHNKDLVIFSPKAQFIVFGRTAITPSNAAIVLTTKFESEANAHPVGAGRNVFFASNFGRYTGIREFYADGSSEINDSRPITQHVNKYIVGKARQLTASANYDTLLVHTDTSQKDVYLYQYVWNDTTKLQSAWSTWSFSHEIVHSFFDEDVVYKVMKVGNDYFLLRMHLDVQDSEGVDYPICLDHRFDVTDCFKAFVLPFDFLASEEVVCVQGEDCPTPGLTVAVDNITHVAGTGYVVTLKKNMNGGSLICGTRYKSRYMPTMPAVKDQGGVVIGTANMRARAFLVTLDGTGEITGIVRSKYGDGAPVTHSARIVGDIDNTVGEQPLSDNHFVMPFRQKVNFAEVEFHSDSHLPMGISDIEYVGQYNKRGRRIANTGGKQ